jgi:hypothetical protein
MDRYIARVEKVLYMEHGLETFFFLNPILFGICIRKKLHGLSPRTNYSDRETAACRRSVCQLFEA